MFNRILQIALALCVAAVVGGGVPAAKYPAGVSPYACPNYPYCDNVALAAYSAGHHLGALAPYAAPAYAAYGHHGVAVAAKYPAGVSPHACPNYPYCDNVALAAYGAHGWSGASRGILGHGWAGAYAAAPAWRHGVVAAHHGAGARYPAGLDPHTCPNYPYCH
ncbi:cuticle protein 1-like [Hetaerina americana]|uniref:cuticle protein 1-like n=1 Tax=Hetaerina americana TaxID=62018 RepID=UPI003A7F2ED2